jgi:hypothetical protein
MLTSTSLSAGAHQCELEVWVMVLGSVQAEYLYNNIPIVVRKLQTMVGTMDSRKFKSSARARNTAGNESGALRVAENTH